MWTYNLMIDTHLNDQRRYRRLIKKLIYLTITRPDITFVVGVLSRFMYQPREAHWSAALKILAYIKGCQGKGLVYRKYEHVRIFGYSDSGYVDNRGNRKSTTRNCTFAGENIVTWRSKKQDVISRSSAKAEYRVMAHTACEMVWLKNLLVELSFRQFGPMHIHCHKQSAFYIAQNLVFHKRTKYIEVDYHFIGDAWTKNMVTLQFTPSLKQLADRLTNIVSPQVFSNLCNKLDMLDIYAPV